MQICTNTHYIWATYEHNYLKKLSVIIATYNGAKTIQKTIESIINQTGKGSVFDLEIIVADDASTDQTVELVRQYSEVTILQNPTNTGGPNAGRNLGIQHSSGDYLAIVDQDDLWMPDKVITFLPYLEKAPIVSSGFILHDTSEDKVIRRVNQNPDGYVFFAKDATFKTKLSRSMAGQQTYLGSLIYSSSLKDIFFETHFGAVDYDWILRLFHLQESIEICQPLYTRIIEGSNLSLNPSYRAKDFYYSLYFIEKFLDSYPKESRQGFERIHGTRARFFYLLGNMERARFYFRRSPKKLKTLLYYLSTYYGHQWVKKTFRVFG